MDSSSSLGGATGRRFGAWPLIVCLPVAIACALVPFAGVRALGGPLWLAIAAALAVFPLLPFVWHFLAERKRLAGEGPSAAPFNRFGLRSLAVGLLVLAVAFSSLGPRPAGRQVAGLFRRGKAAALDGPAPRPPEATPLRRRHDLEGFIPADANLVVALSDTTVLQQLLARSGGEPGRRAAALEKCQILVERASALIIARDGGTRLMVVRAPGVTDPRNLYCLVGFLGSDRLKVRFSSEKAPVRFEIEGLAPRPLKFQAVDDKTVVASDGAWGPTEQKKLFAGGDARPQGTLAAALERIDRGASLWAAGVVQTGKGPWDLALDARFEGTQMQLRGSSIPPAGEAERAELEMTVPFTFASTLPEGALADGIRGLISVIAAAGANLTAPPTPNAHPAPAPARPRKPHDTEGAKASAP